VSIQDVRAVVPGMARLFPPGRVAIVRLYGPIGGGARTADFVELAAEAAGVPARSAPVRLHRSLFGRLAGRFAVTLADAVADEIEARLETRIRT